jgi:hypothetical protein
MCHSRIAAYQCLESAPTANQAALAERKQPSKLTKDQEKGKERHPQRRSVIGHNTHASLGHINNLWTFKPSTVLSVVKSSLWFFPSFYFSYTSLSLPLSLPLSLTHTLSLSRFVPRIKPGMYGLNYRSNDDPRTSMHWSSSPHASLASSARVLARTTFFSSIFSRIT